MDDLLRTGNDLWEEKGSTPSGRMASGRGRVGGRSSSLEGESTFAAAVGPINPNTTRPGRAFRPPYRPRRVPDGRKGQRFHLGKNKEAFDAELFAIHRSMKVFLERQETWVAYTIFSDSAVTIERVFTDRAGPGQALARAVIKLEGLLVERGSQSPFSGPPPTRRSKWPTHTQSGRPSHSSTRWAREANLSHLKRKAIPTH